MRAGFAASMVALLALGLGGISGGGAPSPLRGPNLMTYIAWTSPMDGEQNVPVDAAIMVGLRDVNPVEFSLQFTISPEVSGVYVVIQWTADETIVAILHDPFLRCADYTVAIISPNLDPGPVPNPWSFTTECMIVPADNLTLERW